MPSPPPADESAPSDLPEPADLTPSRRGQAELGGSIDIGSDASDASFDAPKLEDSELEDSEIEVLDSDDVAVIELDAGLPFAGAASGIIATNETRGIENERPLAEPFLVAASGFEAVTPQVFARIGLQESETRVVTIRNASRRTANQILAAHRSGAVPSLVDPLADLAWTTYRLVDPRYRLLPFQQVRVGRILPLLLHQAAIDDLAAGSGHQSIRDELTPEESTIGSGLAGNPSTLLATNATPNVSPSSPVLFGRSLPVVSYPTTMDSATTDLNLEATGNAAQLVELSHSQSQSSANVMVVTRIQSESMQAYAELRQSRAPNRYRMAVGNNRVMIGMIVAASAAATLLVAFAIRRSITPEVLVAQTTKHQARVVDRTLSEPIESAIVRPAPSIVPDVSPASTESTESILPASEIDMAMPESMATEELAREEMPALIDPSEPIGPSELMSPSEPISPSEAAAPVEAATPADSVALAEPTSTSETPAVSMKSDTTGVSPSSDSITSEPIKGESIATAMGVSVEDSPPAVEPTPIAVTIPWDSEDTQLIAAEIWERTPSAARRFTLASAAELIDQWDFDAELSGYGTVEHAAARSLSLRAAWLVEPFVELVDRIRERGPIRDLAESDSSDSNEELEASNNDPTYHLKADELELLIRSWETARGRVVIADDLDQLLHQANVLVDRILVSDEISPFERSDLVSAMTLGTERLTRIARDEIAVNESSQLAEALESFPEASELERLESSDEPSGFLGRVRCLKQRQWDLGLEWLTHTSDRAIASCAKAEWELANSDDATTQQWIELAERWTKVAVRLPDREAAAVNLHAIELFGRSKDYESKREELTAELPRYMAP